jgi:hypothetical protein
LLGINLLIALDQSNPENSDFSYLSILLSTQRMYRLAESFRLFLIGEVELGKRKDWWIISSTRF